MTVPITFVGSVIRSPSTGTVSDTTGASASDGSKTFKTADEIVRIRTGGEFQTVQEYGQWARTHNGSFAPLRKVDIPGTRNSQYDPLDLSNVPEFRWETVTVIDDLKKSIDKLAVFGLAVILLFYLSFVSFTRYDVR